MSEIDTERRDELFKQLEFYSNAIVAFGVVQSLTYAYYFGTSRDFNCYVKEAAFLSEGLSISFIVVAVFSVLAIRFCGNALAQSMGEHAPLIRKIYRAKIAIVTFFNLIPLMLTFFYGVLVDTCTGSDAATSALSLLA